MYYNIHHLIVRGPPHNSVKYTISDCYSWKGPQRSSLIEEEEEDTEAWATWEAELQELEPGSLGS